MKKNININLLEKIINIPTLSCDHGQCLTALQIIKNEIENHQIPCLIGENSDFPFLVGGDSRLAKTLILSHIDVVPGSSEQFRIKIRSDKLFGRGVLDMKGPLVACLDSFIRLWKTGQKQFLFVVTSDEEIGGFNGSSMLTKTVFKNIRNAIIPDSSGNSLVIIQKAPFHVQINSIGKSCHGSKPWEGVNAADKLWGCCKEIVGKINKNCAKLTSACLSQFHCGKTTNTIPDSAMATLDIRIREEKETTKIIELIDCCVNKWNCDWEKIDEALFFQAKVDNLFIKKWVSTFNVVTKRKLRTKIECGASDARFLWHDLKIPIIVTSAIGGGAHSNNEWVSIKSLGQLSKIVYKFGMSI